MLIKVSIALVFFAMVISLGAGAGFLLRDGSTSRRLLTSLKWRIGLGCLLMGLLLYGFLSGQLG